MSGGASHVRLLVLCCALTFLCVCAAQSKPNIVFIMIDDYGWANIGFHRENVTKEVQTPNLDELAQNGVQLDRHYVFKVCSPTRSAFLSGRNPIHVNVDNIEATAYNPDNKISGYQGVPPNMTLIPKKLKQAGYATHYVGKWDAGMATEAHVPVNRGFDSGYGYFHHANDYWTFRIGTCEGKNETKLPRDLWRDHGPAYEDANPDKCSQQDQSGCVYEDDLFIKEVVNVIDKQDTKTPFFLYFAPHNIHTPLEVPKDLETEFSFITDRRRALYAAKVNHADTVVGTVVQQLKQKGLYNNTLIVISSDNGGAVYNNGSAGGNNWPLKGGKEANWEGGVRANALASGGFLPKSVYGKKIEGFIGIEDWYTTFCALAGVDPFDESAHAVGLPPVDGVDVWPLISGANSTSARTEVILGSNTPNGTVVQGLIVGNFKLLIGELSQSGWQGPFYPNATKWDSGAAMENCGETGCLFDVFADPTEHQNIVSSNKPKAKELLNRINEIQKTVFSPNRGKPSPRACSVAEEKYKGFWGPFA